jgi:hypothetical protein
VINSDGMNEYYMGLIGKMFPEISWDAAAGRGLFRFLRAEDLPPEKFAPLAVRQTFHHPVRHRQNVAHPFAFAPRMVP